jgi:antitoxin component YwqK of YwqJK toxin-antitoxin module
MSDSPTYQELQNAMDKFPDSPFLNVLEWISDNCRLMKVPSLIDFKKKEVWSSAWIPGQEKWISGSVVSWIYTLNSDDRYKALSLLKNIRRKLGLSDSECNEAKVEEWMNSFFKYFSATRFTIEVIHYLVMNLEHPEKVKIKNKDWEPNGEIECAIRLATLLPFRDQVQSMFQEIRRKVNMDHYKKVKNVLDHLIIEFPDWKRGYGLILLLSEDELEEVKSKLKLEGLSHSSSFYNQVKGTLDEYYFEGIRRELGIVEPEEDLINLYEVYHYSLLEIEKRVINLKINKKKINFNPSDWSQSSSLYQKIKGSAYEPYFESIRKELGIVDSEPQKRRKVELKTEDGKPFISYFELENGDKDGEYIEFWPHTNIVRLLLTFKEGKKHGPFVRRNENGQVVKRGQYNDGKIDGDYFVYCDGKLTEFHQYKNGVFHGIYRTYSKDKSEMMAYCDGVLKKDDKMNLLV